MEYWKNTSIEDIKGEEWVDALGFDGIYEVSNLGRVKSLGRFVPARDNSERWVSERILKQSNNKQDGSLLVALSRNTKRMQRLIFESFNPEITFNSNEVVMHVNKNLKDNRLCNLEKVVKKESKAVDMIKSKKTVIATYSNFQKAKDAKYKYYKNRTEDKCSKCGEIKPLTEFQKNKLVCNKCENLKQIKIRQNYKPKYTHRTCTTCKENKSVSEFYKNKPRCRVCTNKYMKELRSKS